MGTLKRTSKKITTVRLHFNVSAGFFFSLLVADKKRVDFKNGNTFAIASVYPSSIFMYSNYFVTPQSTHIFTIHRFYVSNAMMHDNDTFYKELSNQQLNILKRAFKLHCCDLNI